MAGMAFAGEGDGVGFATESYAASALYATLANLSGARWRIKAARSGASVGAYDTFGGTLVMQLISPMTRDAAATFLPRPDLHHTFLGNSSDRPKRDVTGDPAQAGGSNEDHFPEWDSEHNRSTRRSDYSY